MLLEAVKFGLLVAARWRHYRMILPLLQCMLLGVACDFLFIGDFVGSRHSSFNGVKLE